MLAWIVTIGEPLPRASSEDRLHRSGMIAQALLAAGHEVVWWGSSFDHFTKQHHYIGDKTLHPQERFRMELLDGGGYRRNISFQRIRDHRRLAAKFRTAVEKETRLPDVILCSFPSIELADAASDFGKRNGIPVYLDIRDLWPDIFVGAAPGPLRGVARLALTPLISQTRRAMKNSAGVIGISPGYLDWALTYAGRARRDSDALFPLGYQPPTPALDQLSAAETRLLQKGVDPSRPIAWFIGTFGRTYDLTPVIETARKIDGKSPVQFVLSGNGEDLERYEALSKNLSNVVFTGWMNAAEIAWVSRHAQIGLAAYAQGAPQGLPNKFFEYLSAGIPLVSALQGEGAALLEEHDCGLSYDPSRPEDFFKQLSVYLGDPSFARASGARGRALYESRFSADAIYPKITHFLEAGARAKHIPQANA
ncbi:glycosyltransferase family 4 protein [bacterium]|nr:glycosyltransferase family 4 protein [bacterium]